MTIPLPYPYLLQPNGTLVAEGVQSNFETIAAAIGSQFPQEGKLQAVSPGGRQAWVDVQAGDPPGTSSVSVNAGGVQGLLLDGNHRSDFAQASSWRVIPTSLRGPWATGPPPNATTGVNFGSTLASGAGILIVHATAFVNVQANVRITVFFNGTNVGDMSRIVNNPVGVRLQMFGMFPVNVVPANGNYLWYYQWGGTSDANDVMSAALLV